jgi:outer membrane protein OmpA-like peptidoglycan-associated protein
MLDVAETTAKSGEQKFTLSSDVLFAFDKSDEASIKSGGTEQMTLPVKKIEDGGDAVTHIRVVGYTDRLDTVTTAGPDPRSELTPSRKC